MQTRTCLLSEVYSTLCRLVARCLGAYLRVVLNGGVVAVLLLCVLHVAVDDVGILAVSHNRQLCLAEQLVQHVLSVDEHVARRRTHEELDARHAVRVDTGDAVDVIVCSSDEEAVVDVRLCGSILKLCVECFLGCGLRLGVRHVEVGGDTAVSRSTTLGLHVRLLGESGVAEVHMAVDHSGHNKTPRGIYDAVVVATRCFCTFYNVCNGVAVNNEGRYSRSPLVDKLTTKY